MKESLILCEGYHDRAFWAGWLERLGCTDPGKRPGKTGRETVLDPWDQPVNKGQFGYDSKGGKFVRILHCGGKRNVLREARNRLREERNRVARGPSQSRLARLVLNVDPDTHADGTSTQTGFRQEDLRSLVAEFDASPAEEADGDVLLFDRATIVSLVRWEASDPPTPGLPNQQTLERLVSAALVAAYPNRGAAVQGWLDARPEAPEAGPKEFAWSHMAGWYAEEACEAFYRALWRESKVVGELESRLRQCGAWRVAQALAE